jgi:hypothetical protein
MKAFKACVAGLEDPRKGNAGWYDLPECRGLRWVQRRAAGRTVATWRSLPRPSSAEDSQDSVLQARGLAPAAAFHKHDA